MNRRQQAQAIAEGALIVELVEEQKRDLYAEWTRATASNYNERDMMQAQARALDAILWKLKECAKAIINE